MHHDEWSGVLFYETVGEFGESGFEITANEVFLMDIGSSAYTEYTQANPDFIKLLMENPDLRKMKKGHIHSHNTMTVFFSPTDNSELKDNSGSYNYYVSLIVNNKNDACAKVAFRAKETLSTDKVITYMTDTGKPKSRRMGEKSEEDVVYYYDCEVFHPNNYLIPLGERIDMLRKESDKKKEETKKIMAEKAKSSSSYSKGTSIPTKRGFHNGSSMELFDDVHYQSRSPLDDYHPVSRRVAESSPRADEMVHSFLVKLLTQDYLYEGRLHMVLGKLYENLYKYNQSFPVDPNPYYDSITERAEAFYADVYPNDPEFAGFNKVIEAGIDLLESYRGMYPQMIDELVDSLVYAQDDQEEEIVLTEKDIEETIKLNRKGRSEG